MKREISFSPFNSPSHQNRSRSASHTVVRSHGKVSLTQRLRFYLRTIWWLFWRAWIVRARNRSQLISQLVYAGISPGFGLAVTFSHVGGDVAGV